MMGVSVCLESFAASAELVYVTIQKKIVSLNTIMVSVLMCRM